MRILIVDDEYSLLQQLRQILESQRYIVNTAADGEKALDDIFDQPFDLIILDIMLPKGTGCRCCGRSARPKSIRPFLC